MSKIAVTGAAGFIGSFFSKELLKQHPATALLLVDDLESFSRPCAKDFAPEIEKNNPSTFLKRIQSGDVHLNTIFHIGACSNTEELREDYLERVNVEYSKALWGYACQKKIPFLYASSAATYGDGSLGFSDDLALIGKLQPLNPYGWSKQKFDTFALEQVKAGRTPPVWAGFKYFNVYGPGEEHKGSQASVAFHGRNQMLQHGFMKLFESDRADVDHGEQKRDFIYVGDVARVMEFFAAGHGVNGIYNVGTGAARSFNDLSQAVSAALKLSHQVKYVTMPEHLKGRYQYFTQATISNLRKAGYKLPMTSLEDGVKEYFKNITA